MGFVSQDGDALSLRVNGPGMVRPSKMGIAKGKNQKAYTTQEHFFFNQIIKLILFF